MVRVLAAQPDQQPLQRILRMLRHLWVADELLDTEDLCLPVHEPYTTGEHRFWQATDVRRTVACCLYRFSSVQLCSKCSSPHTPHQRRPPKAQQWSLALLAWNGVPAGPSRDAIW